MGGIAGESGWNQRSKISQADTGKSRLRPHGFQYRQVAGKFVSEAEELGAKRP
jgi:hypothetical protein